MQDKKWNPKSPAGTLALRGRMALRCDGLGMPLRAVNLDTSNIQDVTGFNESA